MLFATSTAGHALMASRNPHLQSRDGFLTRAEAVDILAVKPATLYTYVSRGLIRRLPTPGQKHSLYYREDIERVRARHDARAAEGVIAAPAVRYGEPIVSTSVTEIRV